MARIFDLLVIAVALTIFAFVSAVPKEVPWSNVAISASPNGRYLYRTKTNEPFFWIADTNWELFHKLNRTDVDLYLADRAAKGFNVIQAVLLSKYNATTIPNFYGDLAIDNEDVTQPNEGYFSFVDWVVTRAAEYGVLICFVPTWSRWVNRGWYGITTSTLFDEDNAQVFGRFLGKRYPGIPKMLGGDTNAFWAEHVPQARAAWRENPDSDPLSYLGPITDTRPIWAAMMKGFREEEALQGYDAFVTFQPTSPWIADPPTPLPYGHNVCPFFQVPYPFGCIPANLCRSISTGAMGTSPWMVFSPVTRGPTQTASTPILQCCARGTPARTMRISYRCGKNFRDP